LIVSSLPNPFDLFEFWILYKLFKPAPTRLLLLFDWLAPPASSHPQHPIPHHQKRETKQTWWEKEIRPEITWNSSSLNPLQHPTTNNPHVKETTTWNFQYICLYPIILMSTSCLLDKIYWLFLLNRNCNLFNALITLPYSRKVIQYL
jgi:hypothetical protein